MKLNHIDLQVPDVQAMTLFFERYFGLELTSNRGSPAIAFLTDHHGMVLVLQRQKDASEAYPDGFHIGFLVDDEDTVVAFHGQATEGGLTVSDVQRNNRGTMVYCRAPGGLVVEVSCRKHGPRG